MIELDKAGYVAVATPGTRLGFDVGLRQSGPTGQLWLELEPDPTRLHVFGLEGDPLTAWSLRLALDSRLATANRTSVASLRARAAQYTLVPAACGEADGYAQLELGHHHAGVGAGLPRSRNMHVASSNGGRSRGRVVAADAADDAADGVGVVTAHTGVATVPVLRLERILDAVRADAVLEVLKIDAKGADADVLRGVGLHHLRRFRCVVGEFGGAGGAGSTGRRSGRSVVALLQNAGFRRYRGVWFNLHAAAAFGQMQEPNLCFNHEMKGGWPNEDIARFLEREVE